MRYFIKFSYDGSCFNGFQRQPGVKTVQGTVEDALVSLNGNDVNLCASGRTDKGVHAFCQCAHFDLDRDIKEYNLKKYLYSYYINMGEFSPIRRNYVYQLCDRLDVSLIKEASLCLLGEHDFRSFCTDEKNKDNCVRTIYSIDVFVLGDVLKITFCGNGFLRKMIRNIVAILIDIGLGKKDVSFLKEVLDNKSRTGNLQCVSGCGLYLEKVIY